MSGDVVDMRGKRRRRVFAVTVGLLAALAGSALVLSFVERVREASDRAT